MNAFSLLQDNMYSEPFLSSQDTHWNDHYWVVLGGVYLVSQARPSCKTSLYIDLLVSQASRNFVMAKKKQSLNRFRLA